MLWPSFCSRKGLGEGRSWVWFIQTRDLLNTRRRVAPNCSLHTWVIHVLLWLSGRADAWTSSLGKKRQQSRDWEVMVNLSSEDCLRHQDLNSALQVLLTSAVWGLHQATRLTTHSPRQMEEKNPRFFVPFPPPCFHKTVLSWPWIGEYYVLISI